MTLRQKVAVWELYEKAASNFSIDRGIVEEGISADNELHTHQKFS